MAAAGLTIITYGEGPLGCSAGTGISKEDGDDWAHLFGKQGLQARRPAYGRGPTPEDAAESARHRYEVDEESGAE
jgi:hypothetical protein